MYRYEDLKPTLFTDEGQRRFLTVRDNANKLVDKSGAFRLSCAFDNVSGDSWEILACIDRLVELREFRYACKDGATQDWILVKR